MAAVPFVRSSDETQLSYTDWGGDRPVVFAHAWGLNGDMWSYQIPAFAAAGLRCVTYDRRGHGRSDRSGRGYDLDTLADDLAALVAQLALPRFALVAHSMGAAEAVRYLSRHGTERVDRLVLSAPTTPYVLGSGDPDTVKARLEADRRLMCRDIGAWLETTGAPEQYFGANFPMSKDVAEWTRRQIVDTPVRILQETHRAFTMADFRTELSELTVPTLVIQGSADLSSPLEYNGRRTAALVPGSRLVVVDGAGHGVYASAAERYNAELLDFIQSEQSLTSGRVSG